MRIEDEQKYFTATEAQMYINDLTELRKELVKEIKK